ncbi:MAG: hypothetical protein JSR77_01820 [Planctomycetes bacterium]|nr:hypothetical protein [Planctomycetota bacterium]
MFHRRLLLLTLLFGVGAAPLCVQLSRLALVRGDDLRREAESRLVKRQWTPSVRGTILDRKGRVLAQDRPSFDVSVPYSVITGDWAREHAETVARRSIGLAGWLGLSPAEREEVVSQLLPAFQVHLERGWERLANTLGVPRDQLDARRDAIVTEITQRQEQVVARRVELEVAEAAKRGETLTDAARKAIEKRANQPIAELKQAHVVAPRVGDDIGFACAALATEDAAPESIELPDGRAAIVESLPVLPGLKVVDSGDRDYPYEAMTIAVDRSTLPRPVRAEDSLTIELEGVACHVLGRLRDQVFGDKKGADGAPDIPGDATRRRAYLDANPAAAALATTADGQDRGAYFENDRVGDGGVEGSQENSLRGLRGVQINHLDTGEKEHVPAVAGDTVNLTLDIMLQARVQAAMSKELGLAVVQPWHGQESITQPVGATLNGAAVVLDIDTGEVLAMVSTPTYTRRQAREDPQYVFRDPVNTPFINRCIAKPYPPGSIVKAAVLAGAVTAGNYTADQRIACTGYLIPNRPDIYRCLIYKRYHTTHSIVLGHDLDGSEAVMVSCNIFFYTMGKRMGVDGLVHMYREMGVGDPFGLGVGGEFAGQLGKFNTGADLAPPDAIQMAIGQGPVSWTPMHAANTYATLARGGVRRDPVLIRSRGRPDPRDLNLSSAGVAMALKGLHDVVNAEHGTGGHLTFEGGVQEPIFNASGITIWGKTGTATAPDVRGPDPDGQGPGKGDVLESGDHSWFVILAGRERPQFAIAVVVDYGGSGGKVSGPIANQIVHALIAEGYL